MNNNIVMELPLSIRVHHIDKVITRHFIIALQAQALYDIIRLRIIQLFKLEREPNFVLHFKDGDDFMVISSEQELRDFLQLFGDYKVNLFVSRTIVTRVNLSGSHNIDDQCHPYITCDGCYANIRGTRLKCIICPDFDLCSNCFHQNKHWEHEMIAIRRPVKLQSAQLQQVHDLCSSSASLQPHNNRVPPPATTTTATTTNVSSEQQRNADRERGVNNNTKCEFCANCQKDRRETAQRIARTMEHLRVMGFCDTDMNCFKEIVTAAKGDLHKFLDIVKQEENIL